MNTPYVEYDHTGSGLARYTYYFGPPREGQSDTIVKQPFYDSQPKRWASDLLAWIEGIPLDTPIHIGQHVTAETVGDIVERVQETGYDR